MLREYTNKPTTRLACQISEKGKIEKIKTGVYSYSAQGSGASKIYLEFTIGAKQKAPVAGDYIIQLSKDDVYCSPKDAFEEAWVPKGFYVM